MDAIKEILCCLPDSVQRVINTLSAQKNTDTVTEIRLRDGMYQSIVVSGKELIADVEGNLSAFPKNPLILGPKDLSDTVFKLCEGSVYAHFDELRNGFISKNGIRVGVCGSGIVKEGRPAGFSKYSSINIRIPRHIKSCTDSFFRYADKNGLASLGGILVVSPPCGGKTTFLRSLASSLGDGFFEKGILTRKRVCVIDERGELYSKDAFSSGLCDFISFLPKGYSIELAIRVLSPQYIVCDEIGNESDANALCEGASKGVTFIASCHGNTMNGVLAKPSIRKLFESSVFSTVCELSFEQNIFKCEIKKYSRKDSDVC